MRCFFPTFESFYFRKTVYVFLLMSLYKKQYLRPGNKGALKFTLVKLFKLERNVLKLRQGLV